jgi:transposase
LCFGFLWLPTNRQITKRFGIAASNSNKQADIARAFGLTPAWVSQTLKTFRQKGEVGLITGKRTGAPPRLTMEQLDELTTELTKGAEHHGFSGQVWTRLRINGVIDKLFGVSYDPSQIGRLLKKVGWSRQKLARLARQQDPQAVVNWHEERLPALKKSPN